MPGGNMLAKIKEQPKTKMMIVVAIIAISLLFVVGIQVVQAAKPETGLSSFEVEICPALRLTNKKCVDAESTSGYDPTITLRRGKDGWAVGDQWISAKNLVIKSDVSFRLFYWNNGRTSTTGESYTKMTLSYEMGSTVYIKK